MKHIRTLTIAIAAAASATALYAVPSVHASNGRTTLTFSNQLDTQVPVDVAPTGPSTGDSFYVSSHIVSGATGRVAAACTVVTLANGGIKQCEVDFIFADGTITTRALTDNANTAVHLVVTGGTRKYVDLNGRGTLTPTPTGSDVVLHLH